MADGKSKDLTRRTQSDKVLRNKAFKIVSDPKYDDCERGLASMVYKFFDKSLLLLINLVEVVLVVNQIISSQMSFINQLFKNSQKEKFIHLLEKIFGVLI